jgi:hypothetical protein
MWNRGFGPGSAPCGNLSLQMALGGTPTHRRHRERRFPSNQAFAPTKVKPEKPVARINLNKATSEPGLLDTPGAGCKTLRTPMARPQSTEIGTATARNRHRVYVLCGLTVVACAVAGWLILRDPPPTTLIRMEEHAPPPVDSNDPEPPPPDTTASTSSSLPPRTESPRQRELAEASRLFDEGIRHLRLAMKGVSGAEETEEEKKTALENLLASQAAYEAYLEKYPDQEDALDSRLTDLNSQIYWCRKTMAATSFPTTGETVEPRATSRPTEPRPETPRTRPEPTFRPEAEAARFKAAAARALNDGRPDRIVELGAPLIADPRMKDHLGEMPEYVALAKAMEAVLLSAVRGLAPEVGRDLTLALRKESVAGVLQAAGDEGAGPRGIRLGTADGPRTVAVSDLSAGEILRYAEAAGGLAGGPERLAAGAYLVFRGDHDEGVRQLILAKGAGEDVTTYSHYIDRSLQNSVELRALDAWVTLESRLEEPDAELYGALDSFKQSFHGTDLFATRREEIFKAMAKAGEQIGFDLADLYRVLDRKPGKTVKLEYAFEDGDELLDFGTRGEWTVADGALTGSKGEAWLERFSMKDVDLRFVLRSPVDLTVVLWQGGRDLRGGLNLTLALDPTGLIVSFHNGRRRLGRETVRMPKDETSVHLQLRGDKFQVAVNRKVILKGGGAERPPEQLPRVLAFTVKEGPVLIDELELKTDLDLEWALAGGTHQALWIQDYHVTGPFALTKWNLEVALDKVEWPEVEPFDLLKTRGDGTPIWKYVRSPAAYLDLNAGMKPNDKVFAYVVARVWSPDRRTAILEVQTDDGARAWLNDESVLERVLLGNPVRATVKLTPGENLLLLKVADNGGAWWLRARFLTKSGERMPDVICY